VALRSKGADHDQITVTLDTYSHVLPGMQEKAVEAINDVLGECDSREPEKS
jgi:hypothetical protein